MIRVNNKRRRAERKRQRVAGKFNRVIARLIERYWSDAIVEVFEEKKGIPKPDIEVRRNGLKIPIEVKSRKDGYFFLVELPGQMYTVCFKRNGLGYRHRKLTYGPESFWPQVIAALNNYGVSLFLVQGEVIGENMDPRSLTYIHGRRGLLVLSDFRGMENSLDLTYGFLQNGCKD